jgi:hypothetical protein
MAGAQSVADIRSNEDELGFLVEAFLKRKTIIPVCSFSSISSTWASWARLFTMKIENAS